MKKEIFILIMTLVFISACGPKTDGPQPSNNFRTGTQGLVLNFLSNTPPSKLYDQDKFNAQIEIKNLGASNVGTTSFDKIYLSGFDPNIINIQNTLGLSIPKIQGKDQFNLQGGMDIVSFQGDIDLKNADSYSPNIVATACYQYETIASGNICIDPQPFASISRAKSCIPRSIGLGSQGAPISVTNINVEARPQRTQFTIKISNAGAGSVFKYGGSYLAKCNPQSEGLSQFEDIDYVLVEDVKVGRDTIKVKCNPLIENNYLRLINGQGTLYCYIDNLQGSDAYTSTIEVRLKYGYRNTIQKTIEIIKTS